MTYVDLHVHLLPGVDDGPKDLTESLGLAAKMAAAGVTEATVTPHVGHARFPLDVSTIAERTRELQEALDREGIGVVLHPGGEIHPAGATDLGPAELDLVAHGRRHARWVLLEVPFGGISRAFLEACAHVRACGFRLLIAHPERASGLMDGGLARLRPELAAGAVLQVNVCSLLGRHGPEAQAAAEHLVRSRLAYVLASDAHGGQRSHTLADGPPERRLTQANPAFLLRHGIAPEPRRPVRAWSGRPELAAARSAARRLSGLR